MAKIIFNDKTIPEIFKFVSSHRDGEHKLKLFMSTDKMMAKVDELKLDRNDVIIFSVVSKKDALTAIQAVPQIRSKHEDVRIVFCVKEFTYISEVFESGPDYILHLDQIEEKLIPLVNRFGEDSSAKSELLMIKKQGKSYCVNPEKVVCFEKEERKVKVVMEDGDVLIFSASLRGLLDILPDYFIRVHIGFVVNAKKIIKVLDTTLVLEAIPVIEIPVSRIRRTAVKSYLKKMRTGLN